MRKIIGITLLLLFLGVLFTVIGFLLGDETNFTIIDRPNYTLKELTYEASEIYDLDMILDNRDVSIIPSDNNQIVITYYESEYDWFEVETEEEQLTIINRTKWFLGISWGIFSLGYDYNKVEIQLPVSVLEYALDIKTSNGRIDLNDLVQIKELKLISSNGTIAVNDVHVSDYFKLDTSNGKILINDISCDALMNIHTSNGEINIDKLRADNLVANTSNGSITVKIVGQYENYRIEMDTSNGTNYIDGEEKNDSVYNPSQTNLINLDTSNGSIRLNFVN